MSLLPYVFGYDFPINYCPRRLLDQDFGLAITPDDLLTAAAPSVSNDYFRPWKQLTNATRDIGSCIKIDKGNFQINLDIHHFTPEEISVKTADGFVVIEGKHEEKKDDQGHISRQFVRRYALPKGCDPATVESRLSSDGVLTVTAPMKQSNSTNERRVPIQQTGPVRNEIKDVKKKPVKEQEKGKKK